MNQASLTSRNFRLYARRSLALVRSTTSCNAAPIKRPQIRGFYEWVKQLPPSMASNPESWPPRAEGYFDWELPSNEAYQDVDSSGLFTESFSASRRKLDYSYHRNPIESRQYLQDFIMERVVAATREKKEKANQLKDTTGDRPWIVFSAGAMATGKGYVLTKLYQKKLFPLDNFLLVDPDMFKSELPEFAGYLQWSDPNLASTKLHRESTFMADVMLEYALESRQSTLIDGSLRDIAYYGDLFARIREECSMYRIGLLHVVADRDTVYKRAKDRAAKTGRRVPKDVLEESIEQVPRSVRKLSPYADVTFTIENNEDQPLRLLSALDGTESTTSSWKEFAQTWTKDSSNNGNRDGEVSTNEELSPGICHMASAWDDTDAHAAAQQIWGSAYPTFCPRCALSCDGQCGVCIHGVHVCSCSQCSSNDN